MTAATVGQAGAEVLYRVIPGMRASQAGAEYIHRVIPGVVTAQAGVEVLHRVQPSFGVTQAGVEVLHKARPCTTRLAQIWIITRADGDVFRFTSLDRDLTFGGQTYTACHSLTPSASESVAELGSAGSITLDGLLASGAVTFFDLHAGKFDGAQIEALLVPWDGAEAPRTLLRGTFGKVDYSENGFSVDVIGDGARLEQTPLVRPLAPDCRWKFGDPDTCGKDLVPLTVTGTVGAGDGQRGFTDAARAEAAGYFTRGDVTFTGGDNDGITAEIKEHADGGVFTLWPRLPFPIAAGDTNSITPGCTNLPDAIDGTNGCNAWDRYVAYGGHPSAPGADKVSKAPDVKKAL